MRDMSKIFDAAAPLSQEVLNRIRALPYTDDRTFRSGVRYDEVVDIGGHLYPFVKSKRLTLDSNATPNPAIIFGTLRKWLDPIPRAYFVVAETLVVRLTGQSITLHLPYSPEPVPPDPPRAPFKTPDYHIGSDGEPGFHGAPPQSMAAYLGPPIHVFFKNFQLQGDPEPGDRWLKIRAAGSKGQDGGVGGIAGNCDYGQHYCTTANGHGGRGGDAAHGFGGGQFFVYAPNAVYSKFRDVTQFFIEGGEPGVAGQPGSVEPPQPTPITFGPGLPARRGNVGDVRNIASLDPSTLFPPR